MRVSHDDDVLWIVPGSHHRANTAEEDRQLAEKRRVPLPGGMPVELEAGDGVVYRTMILHWPSNYSTRLRRVIHLGYRPFGGQAYPYSAYFDWNLRICVSAFHQAPLTGRARAVRALSREP